MISSPSPLHSAAFLCNPKIVLALLDKGADKNARNNSGSTALESVEVPWETVNGIYDFIDGIIFKPLGAPLDYERKPDNTLAREKLDWEPKIQLEEEL